jgi:flagellar motor protein MotB
MSPKVVLLELCFFFALLASAAIANDAVNANANAINSPNNNDNPSASACLKDYEKGMCYR